jgi:hypothetical protein
VFESLYPCYNDIDYKGHGIYMISNLCCSNDQQARLKALLGDRLGEDTIDGYTYPIYEMKGTDQSKGIIVQNNRAYFEYYYIFPDTITYNGAGYVLERGNDKYSAALKGKLLGKDTDGRSVYAIKGADPSDAIIVIMSGSMEFGSTSEMCTFVRDK